MADQVYVSTPEDMAVFDELPPQLKKFLDNAPAGVPATPVRELYDEKIQEGWTPTEACEMVIRSIQRWMQMSVDPPVKDFRPLVAKPKKRRKL